MLSLDKKLYSLADRYWKQIMVFSLFACSIIIRIQLLPHCDSTLDWGYYLSSWIDDYRSLGFSGLGKEIGDYYIAYNVILAIIAQIPLPSHILVGVISCIAEYATSIQIFFLCRNYFHKSRFQAAMISICLLFIPTCFINGALWKQCDAIFAYFTISSLRYLMEGKHTRAFIAFGLSFSFKLQAIFLLPYFCLSYFKERKFTLLHFFWIPLVYLITGLPAIFMGRSVTSTYGIYLSQTHANRVMNINSANFWAILSEAEDLYYPALVLCIAILLAGYTKLYTASMSHQRQFLAAAWTIMTCFMFLPSMHERYDYAGQLLLYLCAVCQPGLNIVCAILFQLTSLLSYAHYYWNVPVSLPILGSFAVLAYLILSFQLFSSEDHSFL